MLESDIAIRVENLSKRYRIGLKEDTQDSLGGAIGRFLTRPISNLRRLRRLTKFSDNGQDPDDVIWAVKDVSFEVKVGEVVGIIGRNGAGKSTLLKILSRITEPTEGYAEIKGRVGSLLEVGTGFSPELTGRENVYLNGTILGMTKKEIDRKFDEIVDFSGVEKFIDTPVKRYSSGMKVRLAFAVAAHFEPEILIVDEVLAVGDAEFQKKCLGKMGSVATQGRTILFVSHNMAAIQSLCERSILLDSGRIRTDGPSMDVIAEYFSSAQPGGIQESAGEFDLTLRENDYQPDNLIAQKMRLFDSRGKQTNTFLMGQEMNLVVDVKGLSDYQGATISVIFKTNDDRWITSISSGMSCSGIEQPRREQEQSILRIPRVPLTPGSYWIDISVYQDKFGRLDYVERAGTFNVAEADVYGTGFKVTDHFGLVYLDASWQIKHTAQ